MEDTTPTKENVMPGTNDSTSGQQGNPVQWAYGWAALGIPVFPIGNGKAPGCKHGFYDASANPDQIGRWVEAGHARFGAAAGHGIVWLDADTDNRKRAAEGKQSWDRGHIDPDEVKSGFPVGVDKKTGAGHYAFKTPLEWAAPPRTKPDPKDEGHRIYDLTQTPVSTGTNLAGSNCIDFRCWGGYVKLKGPPPPDGLPILPNRLRRQLERARGLGARTRKHEGKAKRIKSVEDAVEHIRATAADGRHPALGRAVMPLVRFRLAGDTFNPSHPAVTSIVAVYAEVLGGDRDAESEVHRDFRSAFEEVDGQFKDPAKARAKSMGIEEVEADLGGHTLTGRLAQHGIRIRYNVRWMLDEISRNGGRWEAVTDRSQGNARLLCGALLWEDRVWLTLWQNTLLHNEVDPFQEYLEGLLAWDGVPRVDDWACQAFLVKDDPYHRATARWLGIHVFLGTVKRTLEPGTKLDVTPVIEGKQGIGKSWHLGSLFPATLRGAFGDELNMGAKAKEMFEAIQGKALVEIAEMHGMTRARLDGLKAFMTRTHDNGIRLAYRKNPEVSPRRCVFVGTVNDDGTGILPDDPTGNRRWTVVSVEGRGATPDELMTERDQFWAEALHRVKMGEDPSFPAQLAFEQAARNAVFKQMSPFEELLVEIEAKLAGKDVQPLTMEWIMGQIGLLGEDSNEPDKTPAQVNLNDWRGLSRALTANGWTKVKRHKAAGQTIPTGWLPPKSQG